MHRIERWAYLNRWRHRHPLEKLALAGGMLLLGLILPPWPGAVLVAAIMAAAAVAAGIPPGVYLRLLTAPAGFVAAGALAMSLSLEPGSWRLAVSPAGAALAGQVVLRSLAGVCCLHFLALTTPMVDLVQVLRRARVPEAVTDVMLLVYRFLFVLADALATMRTAQAGRLGYAGIRQAYRSQAMLAAALLGQVLGRAGRLETGLAVRGFQGSLPVLPQRYTVSVPALGAIAALELAVAALSLW